MRNVCGQWADIFNEITDVTGEVFLGLSIGCARCHDHKFDPILQKDYYRLQAFFTPLLPRDDLTNAPPEAWKAFEARRAVWEQAAAGILRQIKEIEQPYRDKGTSTAMAKFPEDIQAISASPRRIGRYLRSRLVRSPTARSRSSTPRLRRKLKGRPKPSGTSCKKELKSFDGLRPIPPEPILTVTDVGSVSPPTIIPGDRDGKAIDPGFRRCSRRLTHTLSRAEGTAFHRPAVGAGPLVEQGRQSTFDTTDRQSDLAVSFRTRTCWHTERLWKPGRSAQLILSSSTGWRKSSCERAGI